MIEEDPEIIVERRKILRVKSRRIAYLTGMVIAIVLILGYSFTVGTANLKQMDVYCILLNQIFPGQFGEFAENQVFIVTVLRQPRVLSAVLIGGILAIGGCLMQSILKNPLATPYTLGVSSGATLGASLYFIFGWSIIGGTMGLVTNTFIFSIIPVAAMMFALTKRSFTPVTLVLCGVAFSYIFSAVNSILQYFGSSNAVQNVVFWAMGDLSRTEMWMVSALFVCLVVYLAFSMFFGKDMDIMRMGTDTAESLGVNVRLVTYSSMILSCFMTAVVVACAGPIGFICLLAPHICRKLVGSDMRWLLPTSALFGMMLLLVSDLIAKTVVAPLMLPVGAVTATIGAPIMVYMLFSKKGMRF